MFNSEREMQDLFVIKLKEKIGNEFLFEEVGNRNFFFRTDIVIYKNRHNIIGYELKLSDFNKLIKQVIKTWGLYDKFYMVVPADKVENLIQKIEKFKYQSDFYKSYIKKCGIIGVDDISYKIIKKCSSKLERDYDRYKYGIVMDMIIRGYHKNGINACKHYK